MERQALLYGERVVRPGSRMAFRAATTLAGSLPSNRLTSATSAGTTKRAPTRIPVPDTIATAKRLPAHVTVRPASRLPAASFVAAVS